MWSNSDPVSTKELSFGYYDSNQSITLFYLFSYFIDYDYVIKDYGKESKIII